ncbi:MAG TPA: hypothetical protein VFF72_06810, partial [Caldimonas sp.]|nr:hypothetical protein [Caldimonas sp.]
MSRLRRRVAFHSLIWVVICLVALAVVAIGATAWGLRADQIAAGYRETDRTASMLADQTTRSITTLDAGLKDMRAHIAGLGIDTPDDFSRRAGTSEMFRYLTQRLALLPQATAITLTGSDGRVVNTTRQWPRPDANFSDRDFFKYLSRVDDNQIYVNLPVKSRLGGTLTVYFSRRVNARNGAFAGVVAIAVEIEYFANIYESVSAVSGQQFLLLRRDGTTIWRYPEPVHRLGEKLPADSAFFAAVRNGGGSYRSLGRLHRGVRLVSVRPLRDYPLVVNVALLENSVLASWNRRMLAIGAGTLLVVCCAGVLLRIWAKQLGRLIASEAQLARKSQE